ncbi:alkaline phosphatase family protein [Microbispora rosea]|uniref:alkaline phosphatase family protein n=1 Tax=Microbispora rosea TaxID=58117 RepID=UPI0037AF3C7C
MTVDTMPDVLALYCDALDALDALGHAEGDESPSMPATLASLDTQLGRLVQGLKDSDLYDDTTFILTGDHGMRHFTHGFGHDALDVLTAAGYHPQFLTAGQAPAAGTDLVMVVGGVANVYLLGARQTMADVEKVRSVLAGVPHVTHVYDRAEPATLHGGDGLGDLVAEPETGWSFQVGNPATPAAYHGMVDVVHPGFLIAGKNIRPNARPDNPRLVDIAPTISALLGMPAPAQAQGRALTETFRKHP